MRITGKPSAKPPKPRPNPSTIVDSPDASPKGQEHGEGSYSGTRDYQEGVKSYLRTADVEKDAHDAAPAVDAEASDMAAAEETGRKGGTKKKRPANGK